MPQCLSVSPVPNWNPIREPPSEETMLRLNNLFQRDILWKEQRWWGTHGVDSSEQKLFLQISAEIFSGFLQKSVLDFSRNLFLISREICSWFLQIFVCVPTRGCCLQCTALHLTTLHFGRFFALNIFTTYMRRGGGFVLGNGGF